MRCLIVDDNATCRAAVCETLERADISVVGLATNEAEALSRYADLQPDVTLVDVDLGPESGFDVARALHRAYSPAPAMILISTHCGQDLADLIADSPALGFLSKFGLRPAAIRALAGAPALTRHSESR